MLSLLEFITPLDATLLLERNLIRLPSQPLKRRRGGKEAQNRRSPCVPGRQETDRKRQVDASADP